jgi:hypothetical protein
MRLSLLSLLALVVLAGSGIVSDAGAVIRVDATYRSPNVRVRVSNKPVYYPTQKKRHLPIYAQRHHKISRQDRMMARRLGRYTGVPARKLIQLRRAGYRWFEIGRWLYVPRPVVRAARHERTWKRFLRQERRLARFGTRTHEWRHVAYMDDDGSYDD